jgi:beta-glucanase (GH16 family)
LAHESEASRYEKMKTGTIILMVLFSIFQSEAQTWNLVWSDEFTGADINASNWTFDTGGSGWGNNELEYYTNRPENAITINGNLLIIAREESYGGKSYTSSRLKTQGLQNFTYGKIEARIKLPLGQGIWPAFWMLGQNISQAGWPQCGEIDIMEHINNENKNYGTMHWDNNGHQSSGGNVYCDESTFHTYSIEWDESAIQWFLDGNQYWQGTIANNVNSTDEFHSPFFIILNVAVGGNWPGNPDETTLFPDTMVVDYVRVYQLAPTTVRESRNQASQGFSLFQNYPNPFNPTTVVSYRLSTVSTIKLTVYDMLGKELAVLVNEKKSPGTYNVTWDGKTSDGHSISNGVYFYRLQAGASVETKKLVIVR